MKAKIIMVTSAFTLGIAGLSLTFIPQEIAKGLNIPSQQFTIASLQLLGAMYLGFSILNYMTRNTIIGGIYGRPLVLANLVHFITAYFALKNIALQSDIRFEWIKAITLIYVIFAFAFAYLLATHPSKIKKMINNES